MSFSDLGLAENLLRAVQDEGYEQATPIQAAAIPQILAGRDIMGCAQTGTGKTAAFALPTLQRLSESTIAKGDKRRIRTLVLAPTRELACQIAESFRNYGRHSGLRHAIVYGGVSQGPQVKMLQRGVDIVVATPGRLCDLMAQGFIQLKDVEILILDEADQMLDLGFIHDMRRIVSQTPAARQTLMFSATMAPEIRRLSQEWLRNPAVIEIAPQGTPTERVEQSVYLVEKKRKSDLLISYLNSHATGRTIVFTRTKHGADKLVRNLHRVNIRAEAIHGDKSQNARQQALLRFKSPKPPVLIATDIAARGLDIDNVQHVVNFDLPMTPEIYVHRIGRTARAGASGVAVLFCDSQERGMLKQIEKLTRQSIRMIRELPADMPPPARREELDIDFEEQLPPPPQHRDRPAHGGARGRHGSAGRPQFGRPASGRPGSGRPGSGRPGSSRPKSGRPGDRRSSQGRSENSRPAGESGPQTGNYGADATSAAERKVRLARRRMRRSDGEGNGPPVAGPSAGYRGPKFKKRSSR